MPPLVSEESDAFSEVDSLSAGLSKKPSPVPEVAVETEATDSEQVAGAPENEPEEESAMDGGGQQDDIAEESEPGVQLQRSAHSTDNDEPKVTNEVEEVDEATSVQTDEQDAVATGDVSMQDAEETREDQEEAQPDDQESAEEDESSEEDGDAKDDDQAVTAASDSGEAESEDASSSAEEEEQEADSAEESGSGDEESESASKDCMFCRQSEEVDENEESEAYLTCAACERNAHQQCARENETLKEGQDPTTWQCPNCDAKTDSESPKSLLARARASNSAPRLVRDLLPVHRGIQKPNSHSIFAQPLISDGEDGGRSLRKRKSPTQEPLPLGKKRRKGTPHTTEDMSAPEPGRAVAHSTRRASAIQKTVPTARILQHRPFHKPPPHKFILAFRLDQGKIADILAKPPRPGKRRDRRRPPKIPPPPIYQAPVPKFPALPTNHLIFPSMFNERESELNAKPYGGILSEQEADTARSLPQLKDREIFEIARREAEEERRRTSTAAEAEINGESAMAAKPNRTVSGPPSKIKCIQFGKFVIDTFYAAPYPEEYSHESRLFICEFCLKYLPSEFVAYRHKLKCPAKHPPGDEIYRDGSISIWEVDGRKKTEYCQCLCLMAKMFLGSKTLYYDVEPFLFYILTEYDELGYHFVGYFSKEKRPASQNNVSCILVMPIHQRKGYATFLIDFSYLLTRIEGKDGSPEKPLSDMGLTAYRSYWDLTISRHLLELGLKSFSTKTLMGRTGMTADDVIHSLERLYAFTRDPVTKTYAIRFDKNLYESIVDDFESKEHRQLRPEHLVWTPYIMGRSDQATLDSQPMQTIAPREEESEDDEEDTQASKSGRLEVDTGQVSPKTSTRTSRLPSEAVEDPELIDDLGVVAPGPPSTEALNNTVSVEEPKTNGINHDIPTINLPDHDQHTGYALAFRTHNIPPARFQIEPPIPPSMLRQRSTKKRAHGAAFGRSPANHSPAPAAATRSSPRNAANGTGSPEKPSTPVRRSGRKSGLAVVESLDGTKSPRMEEEGQEEEEEEEGSADESGQEEESGEEESGDEESEEAESGEDEGDEDADPDPDAEPDEDEEEASGSEDAEEVDAEGESEEVVASGSGEDEDAEGEDDDLN